MSVVEKYYINMTNERYYWCSTLIFLMKKKYSYRQAKRMLKECPLTENIYSDGGWAYFHDMDTEDWAKIICRWEQRRKQKQNEKEQYSRLGITVDMATGLQYKRHAIKFDEHPSLKERYKKKMLLNRNKYRKHMRRRAATSTSIISGGKYL